MSFDKKPLILSIVDETTGLVASVQSTEILVSNIVAVADSDLKVGASLGSGYKVYLGANASVDMLGNVNFAGSLALPGVSGVGGSNTIARIDSGGNLSVGLVSNADVASDAGVVYSKLSLADSLVNADVSSSAAIVYSKLSLANTIVNADVNSAAAIAYSKLSLANTIVDADVASGAALSVAKLATGTAGYLLMANASGVATYTQVAGDVTISSSGNIQLVGNTIVNADVSPSAAIAGTKISPNFGVQSILGALGATISGGLTITGNAGFSAGSFTVNGGSNLVTIATTGGIGLSGSAINLTGSTTLASLAGTAGIAHVSSAGLLSSSKIVENDITAGTITNTSINASAAIALAKLAAGSSGQIIVGNATGVPSYVSASGDLTIGSDGNLQLVANTIVDADVNSGAAIAYSKLSLANTIVDSDVSSLAALSVAKLATGTAGYLLMANAAGVATYTQVAGDVTISSSGNIQLVANTIVNADVNDGAAIAGTKISPDFGAQNIATTGTISNGTLTLNGNAITGLTSSPSNASDAASKGYVDAVAVGLDIKPSGKVIATSNVASLSGTAFTIDGQSLSVGDRVLLTDQTDGVYNGIWVVAAGAWARPTAPSDMATGTSAAGAFMFVEKGSDRADTGWVCTSDSGSAVVGTDALVFTQFSGAGTYTATNGVSLSGTEFSASFDANAGIKLTGTELALALNANTALSTDSLGLKLVLEASNPSFQIVSNELGLKIVSTGGLEKGASGTSLKLNSTTALATDSDGLKLVLEASNPTLKIASNELGLKMHHGLETGASGTSLKLDGSTLSLGASGVKFATLPAQFQVDGTQVSANVTAANISSLMNGGNLSDLHFHDSSLNGFTTDDALSAGDPVYIKSTGNLGKAQASDAAKRGVIGIAKASALAAGSVNVIRDGKADLTTGFTAGAAVYLDGSGGLSVTAPGSGIVRIGFAMSDGDVMVGVHQIS